MTAKDLKLKVEMRTYVNWYDNSNSVFLKISIWKKKKQNKVWWPRLFYVSPPGIYSRQKKSWTWQAAIIPEILNSTTFE